jgi:2,4-dienoyl-CoA reductase-like NADH-dependent reductase (Old Yellow Enzyme family)
MHALRPAAIGSLQLKNCIVRAATSESLALETGEVTPELIAFHRALAEGGVGLSILGHA